MRAERIVYFFGAGLIGASFNVVLFNLLYGLYSLLCILGIAKLNVDNSTVIIVALIVGFFAGIYFNRDTYFSGILWNP